MPINLRLHGRHARYPLATGAIGLAGTLLAVCLLTRSTTDPEPKDWAGGHAPEAGLLTAGASGIANAGSLVGAGYNIDTDELRINVLSCASVLIVLHAIDIDVAGAATATVDGGPLDLVVRTSVNEGFGDNAVIELTVPEERTSITPEANCWNLSLVLPGIGLATHAGGRTLVEIPSISECGFGLDQDLVKVSEEEDGAYELVDAPGATWYQSGQFGEQRCLPNDDGTYYGNGTSKPVALLNPQGTRVVWSSSPSAYVDFPAYRGHADVLLEDPSELDHLQDLEVWYGILLGAALSLVVESLCAVLSSRWKDEPGCKCVPREVVE